MKKGKTTSTIISGGGWNADRVNAARNGYRYWIGIDTGVDTGVAVWDRIQKKLIYIKTMKIHQAMNIVKTYWNPERKYDALIVRFEDARQRKFFDKSIGPEQLQGAGSIKRDASVWEDFLNDEGIVFEMVAPKNNKTKIKEDYFQKLTGYTLKTSVHGRDAAMLVFQM